MVFLGDLFQTEKGNIYKPCFVHYCPFDKENGLNKTKEELESEGVLVDSIPEAENREEFYPEIRVNKQTKEVFYEYIKKENKNTLTQEQIKIKELENRVELMQRALDELSMGGI